MPTPKTPDLLHPAPPRVKALGTFGNPRISPVEAKVLKPKRAAGPEAQVAEKCVDFLEAHGWRAIRMPRGKTKFGDRWVTMHEPGCPDWLLVRYKRRPMDGATSVIWLEMKQPESRDKCVCLTKKPRSRCTFHDQEAWRVREQARGAVVLRISSVEELMAMEVWK